MSNIKIKDLTKINDLIEEFPFVIDTLVELNPKLKRLKNPFLRKTVGRRVSIRGLMSEQRLLSWEE
ncbi:MAG: DUF1858 domain-containing protein [Promethearchaeota archaeon]